jgi:hypothetical protein
MVGGSAGVSPAQDLERARKEISSASDFRVRLAAALVIGRTKPSDGRVLLEKALDDPHPAVRAAAAAALGTYGDAGAVSALERHLQTEGTSSVRTQLQASLDKLRGGGGGGSGGGGHVAGHTKFVVQLGNMRNLTSVRGAELGAVLRSSAEEKAQSIPGAVVVGDAQGAARKSSEHGVPVLVLDGSLVRLAEQAQGNGTVGFNARVEFSVRKAPEQTLKASMSGAATSIGTASSLVNQRHVSQLQDQAVDGAVESAMRGADRGFLQAVH